jgi:hypothetical protein
LYCHASPICPCCQEVEESFEHLLTCHSDSSSTQWEQSLQALLKGLKLKNTPATVIEAIVAGTKAWIASSDNTNGRVHAPMASSSNSGDILFTTAFIKNNIIALGGITSPWVGSVANGMLQ